MKLIADLLNNGHDSVVRAAATAVRNLAIDPRNRASLGEGQARNSVHAHFSQNQGLSQRKGGALLLYLLAVWCKVARNIG